MGEHRDSSKPFPSYRSLCTGREENATSMKNETSLKSGTRGVNKASNKVKQEVSVDSGIKPGARSGGETFKQLLASSRLLTSCGPSVLGQRVMGKIIAIVDDNLYIDFGGKFHGVVPRPPVKREEYGIGVLVEVVINDLEISDQFLGAPRHESMLEADIRLVGLLDDKLNVLKKTNK